MTEILETEWFWAALQAVGVLVTLGFAAYQLRLQTASHVVQTLSSIHQRWVEEPMVRARHSVCTRYLSGSMEFDGVAEYIAEFMEELGNYVKIDAVPAHVMWDAQSWYLEHYFSMFEAGIEGVRQKNKDRTLYVNVEELYKKMKAYSKHVGAPDLKRDTADLRRFAEQEVQLTEAFLGLHRANLSAS